MSSLEVLKQLVEAAGMQLPSQYRDQDSREASAPAMVPADELVPGRADPSDDESLIGLFQAFRRDGIPDDIAFQSLPGGAEFEQRLSKLYAAIATSRRSDSMLDAYFVVRNPPMLSSAEAEHWIDKLLRGWARLARDAANSGRDVGVWSELPVARVLEGKPPKHPRADSEKCRLLHDLQTHLPAYACGLFSPDNLGFQLAEPLYFVACDAMLRDYLRWPLLQEVSQSGDAAESPLDAYFELWRHGVKFRIFRDDQIDFYLPRRAGGELLDAGQFARRL